MRELGTITASSGGRELGTISTPSIPTPTLSESLWSKLAQAKGIGAKFDTLLQAGAKATENIPGAKVGSALGTEIGGILAGETPQQIASQIKPGQVLSDTANAMLTAGSMALPVPKGLPAQVATGAGLGALQGGLTAGASGGNVAEEAKTGAMIGGALPIAFKGASIVTNLLGNMYKGAAGLLSGTGSDVIDQILKTPKAAQQGMRSDVVKTLSDDATKVRQNIFNIRQKATADYSKALSELPGGYQEAKLPSGMKVNPAGFGTVAGGEIKPTGTFIAKTANGDVPLTMKGVKDFVTTTFRDHRIKVENGVPDFTTSTLNDASANKLKKVWSTIRNWKDTSPQGLDALSVKINNYVEKGQDVNPQFNGMVSDISKQVRNYLGDRIPEAKPMVQNYIKQQQFIDKLETYLSDVGSVTDEAQLKNTIGKIQTMFTKNKDIARSVLESLPGGAEILGQQAGRELTTPISRTTATIVDIVSGVARAVISPRWIGEFTAFTGMGIEKAKPIVDALQKLQPAERTVLLQAILSGNQPTENPQ